MRHLREILRHKLVLGRSHRDTARSVGVSAGSVGAAVSHSKAVGLDWAAIISSVLHQPDQERVGPQVRVSRVRNGSVVDLQIDQGGDRGLGEWLGAVQNPSRGAGGRGPQPLGEEAQARACSMPGIRRPRLRPRRARRRQSLLPRPCRKRRRSG
jgi:hypothetical protein